MDGAYSGRWLVLILAVLLACKNGKQEQEPQQQPQASAAAPVASSAPETAAEWKAGPDVVALESIVAGKAKPASVDKSGSTLIISTYEVPDWSLANHAVLKNNAKAWSIHLEGSACNLKTFAPTVKSVGRDGAGPTGPFSASWYAIEGGPLDGLIVKAFESQKPCIVHIATREYATAKNWNYPG